MGHVWLLNYLSEEEESFFSISAKSYTEFYTRSNENFVFIVHFTEKTTFLRILDVLCVGKNQLLAYSPIASDPPLNRYPPMSKVKPCRRDQRAYSSSNNTLPKVRSF